jgi:hypothetical protein
MAWLIHGRELSTAQKHYVRGQSSALVDPVPDFNWIHGIKTLCCFGIGFFATVGAGVPGGVESKPGTGGHAYPIMRHRPENDGTSRGTITIDDHHLARATHAFISFDVGSDPAARVLSDPNRRDASSNSRDQEIRRE